MNIPGLWINMLSFFIRIGISSFIGIQTLSKRSQGQLREVVVGGFLGVLFSMTLLLFDIVKDEQ